MGELFCFPLKQHIGAKAAPAIVKGDTIVRGQPVAYKGQNDLGANVYSSVSGIVTEVTDEAIYVLADDEQKSDYRKLKADTPLALIEESGLVGLGGAGFPTYAKLNRPFEKDGVVIVNAAECEPILEHNIRAIEQKPEQLVRGLEIAMEVVRAGRGIIAIKEIHEKAVAAINKVLAARNGREITVHLLKDMYPMGEERAVIRECLGTLLGVESLPSEAGAIVINAETTCRIQEAVDLKKPLIDKNMTVAGKLKDDRKQIQVFYDVPLGISVGSMLKRAGGLADDYGELIMGGPFTGKRTSPDAPVIKTTGGIIAAECFPKGPQKIGLLVCACGADQKRLEEIAESLGSEVTGCEFCKQAHPVKAALKCENPGKCPGQVQKVMALKKAGAEAILISNCTDCSNTVMSCAPGLGLPVYHCTDGALRAVNQRIIRKIR
ncbi:MAG: proline reductase-associated electron transfer protein PrdC [Eubacterium sp.]|nr:proline reductase-associated electron transfer protein PrdC [Eubacterium sp.]